MRQKQQKKNFMIQKSTNYKYLIWYLDEIIRSSVLILPRKSGYVKTFNVKNGDKDKNNKLVSFRFNDDKLLAKYEAF